MAGEDKVFDCVVIGAGISGLSSAKLLSEQGVDVLVLEARDRVGGRTFTKRDEKYNYCDVGGSYVGPSQNRILRLSHELGLKTYKIFNKGDYVHFSKGKGVRFQGSWPRFWNPFSWLDVNHLFKKMDQLLEEIPVEAPWNAPHAEEWDNTTMKEFFDRICWTEAAKEFGRAFVSVNVTMEPPEVSMLWFLWYVKICGGSKRIWEVDNGGQERKFVGGSMQVSERIAEKLKGKVLLNHPVDKVTEENDIVIVETVKGETFKARYIVIALAPTLLLKIKFDPPLPPLRYSLIQRVPMGSCIKNNVFYKEAWWRKKGLAGFASSADGVEVVGNTVDDCKPDGSMPAITGFIVADQARKLSVMTREERKKLTCECFARMFDSPEALEPIAYEENNWVAEEYSGGCYTSTYPPGVMTRFGKEIRKPFGRKYFAGTETAIEWSGYMDGAVEAGERAAREVLCVMGKITSEKIWQKEPEFKECPVLPFEETILERWSPSVNGALKLIGFTTVATLVAYKSIKNPEKVTALLGKLKWN